MERLRAEDMYDSEEARRMYRLVIRMAYSFILIAIADIAILVAMGMDPIYGRGIAGSMILMVPACIYGISRAIKIDESDSKAAGAIYGRGRRNCLILYGLALCVLAVETVFYMSRRRISGEVRSNGIGHGQDGDDLHADRRRGIFPCDGQPRFAVHRRHIPPPVHPHDRPLVREVRREGK
ncbi:MAG: hypothetical protein Q4Q58_02215 [Thermoplasmata archaeon]|nr:hypothetical protein [Thermoplasmata archaeon]